MILVNLGKWVLRWLFGDLVEEEIQRDEAYREVAVAKSAEFRVDNPPVQTPGSQVLPDTSSTTSRLINGSNSGIAVPGHNMATPGAGNLSTSLPTTEEGSTTGLSHDLGTPFSDKPSDYFSNTHAIESDKQPSSTAEDQTPTALPQSPAEPEKEEKRKGSSLFGKKFRMEFPKKLGRTSTDVKSPVPEEKPEESDKSSEKEEKVFENSLSGVIDRIRHEYETYLSANPGSNLASGITPSSNTDTPVLNIPPTTSILIQEESGDTAVAADLYSGFVGNVRQETDKLEKAVPHWLGELLLKVI